MRRAIRGDEAVLRAVRLEALSEAPEAFGSTYEREVGRSIADWQSWISGGAIFILDRPEGARGMVAGRADPTDPAVVQLLGMWVHPAIRGSGGADELMAALLAWARSEGAKSVQLNVIELNHRARRFYERCGFRLTGQEAIRARDGWVELQMVRSLEDGAAAGDAPAESPCIGNCCLDDDLTCLGCFRSLEEIKEWGVVDDHRRRVILQNARQRRAESRSP